MPKQKIFSFIKHPQSIILSSNTGIRNMLKENGFEIITSELVNITPEQAREFYKHHEGKPFFEDLVKVITGGPVDVLILGKESDNIVQEIRYLVGDKDPNKAERGTIRNTFGTSIEKNSIHAPDSFKAIKRDCSIICPKFENLL